MKMPLSWLKKQAPFRASVEEMTDALIRLGHEVEGVERPRHAVRGVRVGRILAKRPHPNADRLSLLEIDVGAEAPLSIVCGARNMDVGDKVPVATVGTELPGGLKIKKGKIRGEASHGMCCSEAELGLAEHADGLMILPPDAPVGMEVGEWLELEEAVLELSITPNRGDCMSARGLARDLAADMDVPLAAAVAPAIAVDAQTRAPGLAVDAGADCPCYLARRIEGVRLGAAPAWMRRGLRDAGMRAVNGIVDVLNYTMLFLGQPMHAFDADKLSGALQVRYARKGERFVALDGRELTLTDEDLVIADERKVVALAGIIGSMDSAVDERTTNLVLESAYFAPARISRARRHHGLVTEASMRFERGVDPAMVEVAMAQASRTILDLFGGRASELARHGDAHAINAGRTIHCRLSAIEARLGVALDSRADAVLRRMGFHLRRDGDRLEVEVPPFRHDVALPEDMAEEYARIIGFDRVPERLPTLLPGAQAGLDDAVHAAVAQGAVQVISYAFIAPEEQRHFVRDSAGDLLLSNPISDAMRVMRRSLWPGLLRVARHNLNRQANGVHLVEQGRIYERREELSERPMLAWLMAGEAVQDQWYAKARMVDFFDIKGQVDGWLSARRLSARWQADDDSMGLQPGQAARIVLGKRCVGRAGKVAREVAQSYGLDLPVYVAELDLSALPPAKRPRFTPLPEFPAVQRDLVFLCGREVRAEELLRVVTRAGGRLLQEARVFDVYQGQGIPEGKVSIGVRILLRDAARTLTQEECDRLCDTVVAAVAEQCDGALR